MSVVESMALPIVGLGLSIVSFLFALQRASKTDLITMKNEAIKLEHRLTVVEQNQFTNEDRRCLMDTSIKVNMFYQAAKREAPDLLKHMDTPRYDELLSKAKEEIQSLTAQEATELIKLINDDIIKMKQNEDTMDAGKVFMAVLYSDMIRLEKNKELSGNVMGCIH
jgi:hypothetical protein